MIKLAVVLFILAWVSESKWNPQHKYSVEVSSQIAN